MSLDFKCGSEVIAACTGKTVPYTDAGFQLFVGEAISVATGGINIAFTLMSSSLTDNIIKGLNATRCAIVSGGYSVWYFIASAWWLFKFVGQEGVIEDLLDEGYPHICTCKTDVDEISELFGGNMATATKFSSCSEAAEQVKQTN